MPTSEDVEGIWNRALGPASAAERKGDAALRAVLAFHNRAMNGGVLHAMQQTPPGELEAAREGYRCYGFTEIDKLLALRIDELEDEDADPDALDELEEELDDAYGDAIASDETLLRAVEAHIRSAPDAYAPL
jgi:hypothetical protein